MNAAIYARKSTEQNGVADEAKSVTRQVDHALAYAASKGWVVNQAHIYVDDGISGAEFDRRPGYLRLMNACGKRAPFQVLVMSEKARLGREMIETAYAVKKLHQAGVEVWLYLEDRRLVLDSATDKLLESVADYAAEFEREKASQRVTDAMHRKFGNGHVTGCKVFGYRNVEFLTDGKRDHVERVIDPVEAAVVLEIFDRYARGEGYRAIAWALNERHVPAPHAQQGRPEGWDPGTVRAVLDRPLYRGEVVYNRSRKRTAAWGEKRQRARPESEWMRRTMPELQIINEALAGAVDDRRADRASRYLRSATGQLIGRPSHGGKYLLSGLLVCPCGARFEALKGGNWSYRGGVYVCSARRRKGPSVCPHNLVFPIAETDAMILSVIEGDVLAPSFIAQVLDSAFASSPDDRAEVEAERARVAREVENLTTAIAQADDEIPALVARLKARDKQLKRLDTRLAPQERPDRETLRQALMQRVEDWRQILRDPARHARQGRMVLQQLVGEIEVEGTPKPHWLASPRPAGLLSGMVHCLASPTGFEPVFWP
jgi:site-specific DNA recombinase